MNITNKLSSALIYDDHKLYSHCFAMYLESLNIFREVQLANNENETLHLLINLTANDYVYLFLNYQPEEKKCLLLFNDARRISKKIRIILLTNLERPAAIHNIISYKPEAIISTWSGTEVISECLDAIAGGGKYLCPRINHIVSGYKPSETVELPFSNREIEILSLFNNGMSIAEVAGQIHLSRHTIVNHRSNMMKKSGTRSIVELLALARLKGIV